MSTWRPVIFAATLLTALTAQAQTTYRWVDKATGQTVFSDHPPPPGITAQSVTSGTTASDERQLPCATRQAMEKFPVTLYTAANCIDLCKQARDLLNGRGVPFTEKMLSTQENMAEASKRLGSEPAAPSVIVGTQSFKGLEASSWNNLLDLAGYPTSAPYGSKPSGAFAK